VIALARIVLRLLADLVVLYQERNVKPRRVDAATRVSLAVLSRLFDWRVKSRPGRPPGRPRGDQRWATFRLLHVFVVIEHGSRRLVRVAVTAHSSAAWTLQRLREVVGFDRARRYLIHDRDRIFASGVTAIDPEGMGGSLHHGRPHMALRCARQIGAGWFASRKSAGARVGVIG
jgi:hypothetical protein